MKNKASSVFIESRTVAQIAASRDGPLHSQREVSCGVGVQHDVYEDSQYQWHPLATDTVMIKPDHLSAEIYNKACDLHASRMNGRGTWDADVQAFKAFSEKIWNTGLQADLSLHAYDQHIALTDTSTWTQDQRSYSTLGVRIFLQTDMHQTSFSRSYAYSSLHDLCTALPELAQKVVSLEATVLAMRTVVPCPTGDMPIVLGPGHAAVFFHEVCGHPLEGDILVSHTSYLAPWIGRRVAEEWVSLVDDPTPDHSKVAHRIDDEGTPSRPAYLLDHGVIREPLLDKRNAHILKLEPNGHGRRLDFRHYVLPRMTHTQVLPHSGTSEDACEDIRSGLMVYRLKLRHMNIASGDFSFTILEARVIENGRLGPYVGPGLLLGNGLQSLHDIDFVGADDQRFLNAGGGCGKLDQWPLVVSFGQPTVRFRKLQVQSW